MSCSTSLRYTIIYSCILRYVWRCITAATAHRGSLYYTLLLHTRLNQTICTPIQAVPHFTMYSDGHSNTMTAFSSTPHVWHSFPAVPRYPVLPTAVAHAAPLHSAPSCYMMLHIISIWINRRRLYYTLLIHARFSYQSFFILSYWCGQSNYVVMSWSTSLDCTVYYILYYITYYAM